MFGRKKNITAGVYYLNGPLLYDPTPKYGLDISTEESDYIAHQAIDRMIKQWCLAHNYISPAGQVELNHVRNNSHIPTRIYTLNFRSLTSEESFNELIQNLRDTEAEQDTSRILNLHVTLISYGDAAYLMKFINKLYHTLELTRDEESDYAWSDIHIGMPYLWVIYMIQNVLQQHPVLQTPESR